jgi:hypothetical protein
MTSIRPCLLLDSDYETVSIAVKKMLEQIEQMKPSTDATAA